jgi:hypothetical protein
MTIIRRPRPVTPPNKEAVAAVHQKAGHPANELYEVSEGR